MQPSIAFRSALCNTVLAMACACTTTEPPLLTRGQADTPTILLVSREDGSIVRQTINLDADICVKSATSATTTCLDEGDAIFNGAGVLVGYEMHQTTIELQAAE